MRLRIVRICVAAALLAGAQARAQDEASAFVPSSQCIACHSQVTAASGEDVSIGPHWRATIMANSARDPYWHAAVRREALDHPALQTDIEDTCSTCHMPMARFDAAAAGRKGQVFANIAAAAPQHELAFDGVSCTVCHQISAENLGSHASFDGGFVIETPSGGRVAFGPHDVDAGRQALMRSAATFKPSMSTHIQQSELCATCHTLFTTARDDAGREIGTLPEQVPYQEWLHSDYRATNSCQSCHMPAVAAESPITSVLGQPRPNVSQHTFLGGNAFMLDILRRYRGELGVKALPQELEASAAATRAFLSTRAATLSIAAPQRTAAGVELTVDVKSTTGHKLPTAYPSRRAWLHVVVRDAAGRAVFESGAVRPDGSIAGNDNDADAQRFEPHHEVVTSQDEVQIYEAIMVDSRDALTTGLLNAVRFVKDNRLLPRGFDKRTAEPDFAVRGAAADDADFIGGADRVRYRIPLAAGLSGPLTVEAELLYQSISYRWAENLRAYDAEEAQRFGRYYAENAAASAAVIATAGATIPAR
ncbi:MAG TPA: hypothetical protein VFL84_01030 [Gammaproteobacteria bacterium]|nr:hypothetical protein [Gammaproteobacteria bacterium]